MRADTRQSLIRTLLSPLALCSLLVGISGLLVMVGWHTHNEFLIRISPAFPVMKYNAGLAFLLSGAGLLAFSLNKNDYAIPLAGAVATLGLLTVAEYVFGVDLHVDLLFFKEEFISPTAIPGRMAANSAFCFFLTGTNLLLLALGKRAATIIALNGTLASLIFALGGIAFFGHVSGMETINTRGNSIGMALVTSFNFLVLGIVQFTIVWRFSPNNISRSWLPLSLAFAIVTITLVLWQGMVAQQSAIVLTQMNQQEELISENFKNKLNDLLKSLQRLAARQEAGLYEPSSKDFSGDAANLIRDYPGLLSLGYANAASIVQVVEPLAGNESVAHADFSRTMYNADIETVKRTHRPRLNESINLVGSAPSFVIFIPLFENGIYTGVTMGKVEYEVLFRELLAGIYSGYFNITIYRNDELIYGMRTRTDQENVRFGTTFPISFENMTWNLMLVPNEDYLDASYSSLPEVILVAGILLAMAASLVSALAQRIFQQVEELQRSEQALELASGLAEQRRARYSAIFDTVLDGIITLDDQGLIHDFNRQAVNIFGYSEAEVLGKNVSMLMPQSHGGGHDHYLNYFLAAGEEKLVGFTRKLKGLRSDGVVFPIKWGVSEMWINGRRMFTGVVTDITMQEEILAKLEQSNHDLLRSNEALRQFAYIASHDLQEPLRVIASYTQLLEKRFKGTLDEKSEKFMNYIVDGASRMQVMIKGLLMYSRINLEAQEFSAIPLAGSLQAALSGLEHVISESRCKLHYDLSQFPQVYADKVQLSQVFQNLITNAIKYRSQNAPEISIGITKQGNIATISIKDNGLGIEEKYFNRIFEIFQRLHTRNHSEGSGIGLAICRKIVESHGGKLTVTSTPGEGSTFSFTLKCST